jgi:uncharacterized protein YjiS (DUF1127 family)
MITRLKSAFRAASARIERRRIISELMEADDSLLRDLGLRRADIRRAVLGIDPRF